MATRAVYSFTGFPGIPECHLYLHHDGYPTGAAWRFATALREGGDASTFLAAFLSTQARAEPLTAPDQAADAEYRYGIELIPGADPHLLVQCWRRLPGASWHPRCGPTPMALFISRFLPAAQRPAAP
ncbi:hypothetical protein CyaNS01_01155 [Cyanobium sp. NS01]|nr:hypothetical protein CyaNS01_01155 [Cyanobium sp. NS01]